jgi:hypothetical protein
MEFVDFVAEMYGYFVEIARMLQGFAVVTAEIHWAL